MGTRGEMETLAEDVLDEDLTLLLARGEGVPRLGIFNTNTNKRKYVHLSWLEGAGRTLKIKVGRMGSKEYDIETVRASIGGMVRRVSDELSCKMLVWRGVQVLGDLIHAPRSARTEADCQLVAENKRDTLWFAYTPRDAAWRVHACFVATADEDAVLQSHLLAGEPWPGLPLESDHLPTTMRNNHAVKEVLNKTPNRWTELLLPLSKGLLFGFSDWSPGGEHRFGDTLWRTLPTKDFRSDESLASLMEAGRPLLRQLTAYLRLWPLLERVTVKRPYDSMKEAEEGGYKKRERFEVVAPHKNDRRFKATRYHDDAGSVAIGFEPETRLPGEMDHLLLVTPDDWESSLEACSLGGQRDPQFTCNSLSWSIESRDWFEQVRACVD